MKHRFVPRYTVGVMGLIQNLFTLVVGFAFLAFSGVAIGQPASCSKESLDYRQDSFTSGGKLIHLEWFQPKRAGKFPIVLIIHGSGGVLTRHGPEMPLEDNFGEMRIACEGYLALLVHYFDRSGILSTVDKQYMERQSAVWLETVSKALDYASDLPKADSTHVGLFGESLGGYLALSLAMRDTRIKVVSEYGGGIRLGHEDDPAKLPPVLIQHGRADSIVPVAEALRLARLLADLGVCHKIKVYEGINHYPNSQTRTEIEDISIQFFNENLKRMGGRCAKK